MADFLQNTGLQPISLEANTGTWTRVNRNNHLEKSVIDYILATPQVAKQSKNIIIDETGNLRMTGRKESDHNTITMETKCQTRESQEKKWIWRTINEEAWEDFNKEMLNTPEEVTKDYNKFEKFLNKTMAQQLGKITITPGKNRKITSPEIKRLHQHQKQAKMTWRKHTRKEIDKEKHLKIHRIPTKAEGRNRRTRRQKHWENCTKNHNQKGNQLPTVLEDKKKHEETK